VLRHRHQGFFTADAMTSIAVTTIANLDDVEQVGRAPMR
jgi:lactate dehydrogenase-like 2-hydroxyacid dehydrogenase